MFEREINYNLTKEFNQNYRLGDLALIHQTGSSHCMVGVKFSLVFFLAAGRHV